MLDAISITAQWTIDKVNAIVHLQKSAAEHIKESAENTYSHELVEVLFEKPYLRSRDIVDRDIYKSRQAAMTNLHRLVKLGILEIKKSGKETLFINQKLLDLMAYDSNDFESY